VTLRGGLIGCGNVVQQFHVPVWRNIGDVEIVAVADRDEAALQKVSSQLGACRAYTDADQMLNQHPDLDFVSIATPGFTHHSLTLAAIERGLHVLVEKPLALSLADAREMRDRAAAAGVQLCVAQTYRYRDSVLAIRHALADGRIGRVYQVDTTHHGESIFNDPAPWIWNERQHRVLLYEHAIHFLDLHTYFAGPVKRVLAVEARADQHLQCTTQIYALLEHESGAVGRIDLQLFASSNYTQVQVFGTANDATMKFSPESSYLYSGRVNPLDEALLAVKRTAGFVVPTLREKARPPVLARKARSHYRLFSGFAKALRCGDRPVPVSADEVLPTMELLETLAAPAYAATAVGSASH
jgi:predicted dehydrogenase